MPREKFEYVERLKLYRKRIKDSDGKYFAIYGKTPDELRDKVRAAQRAIEDSAFTRDDPTLSEYADRWMQLNTTNIAANTKADYQYIIDSFIKPALGHRKIRDITPDDIKAAMLILNDKSASVYNKVVMLYKRVFAEAVENDLVRKSPCTRLKRGGAKPKKKPALTSAQVTVLLDAVRDTVAYPFIMIGLYAGLRREEILGLQWDCVHLEGEAPYIAVKRAVRWEHNQPVLEERLKSDSSSRNIPIPSQLVDCLEAEKKKSKSDFVISNKTGGARTQTQFKNLWAVVAARSVGTRTYTDTDKDGKKVKVTVEQEKGKTCKRHKIVYTIDFEVTPHILRHTYITNLILGGVDIKTVQYLAGHTTVELTLDTYTHLMENTPADLIGKISKVFTPENPAEE